jgi:hypothetical protein
MTQQNSPSGPSLVVVKQLFAHSGNRCAFPKCENRLIQDNTVIGEICHIKAAKPNGPRYDPEQTPDERHSYSNLILLCANHHKIIDDDPEAYTVERVLKLKEEHASHFTATSDEEAEIGARVLIDHSIASKGQSGGITAHTVNQVFNMHAPPANLAEDVRRQSEARKYLAPELQRTIERVLYIHGRAIANFICHSAGNGIKPNDQRKDFLPYWPSLYPNAPQVRELGEEETAALIAFYDSLHSLSDHVNDWWEREGQLPVNLFNSLLHDASKSLKIALICIDKFGMEELFPPPYEAWGTISSRISRSLKFEEEARKHHIARFEAKAAKENSARPPQSFRRKQ